MVNVRCLEVGRLDASFISQVRKKIVDRGSKEVAKLGKWDGNDEAHRQEEVHPPYDLVHLPQGAFTQTG